MLDVLCLYLLIFGLRGYEYLNMFIILYLVYVQGQEKDYIWFSFIYILVYVDVILFLYL